MGTTRRAVLTGLAAVAAAPSAHAMPGLHGGPMSFPTGAESGCWAGALTSTSFSVNADVSQTALSARIAVSANSDLSNPTYVSPYMAPVVTQGDLLTYKTVAFDVAGLAPNTTYYYQLQFAPASGQGGVIRSLKTAPSGAGAFSFATSSCSDLMPSQDKRSLLHSPIHRSIANENPLFFLHVDDILYSNIATTSIGASRDTNARLYRIAPEVDVMNRTVPFAYIPGDHDMGQNDSTLDTPNAEAIFRNARQAYRETVPHYPFVQTVLGETNIDHVLLTQQADIGKCRFLLLDCMSQSRVNASALGQGLGNGDYWDQRTWLASALNQAVTDGIAWVFVVLPRGWMDYVQTSFADAFSAERQAICDLIEGCDAPCCLINGDTHMGAVDDGTRAASFATDGLAKFPQINASAMHVTPVNVALATNTWNGTARRYGVNGLYVLVTVAADNKSWTAAIKGNPIDETTFVPTTYATVSTADVVPVVSFTTAAPSVAHGTPLTVNLDKTWFGPCSVHWASSDGQSGNVNLKPNKKRSSFVYNAGAAGSATITLSSPSGCTIGGTNPATVTVT
jgi:hypothetical protein